MLCKEIRIFLLWRVTRSTVHIVYPKLSAMPSQSRTPQLPDLLSVHLGSSAIIFGVSIIGHTSVLAEKSSRVGIPADLHTPQLQPAPVRIQLCGPDKAEVDTQGAVHSGAVNTQKHTVRDAGPTRALGATIETSLVGGNRSKPLKQSLDFGLARLVEEALV